LIEADGFGPLAGQPQRAMIVMTISNSIRVKAREAGAGLTRSREAAKEALSSPREGRSARNATGIMLLLVSGCFFAAFAPSRAIRPLLASQPSLGLPMTNPDY
jgi:hypothetical protein